MEQNSEVCANAFSYEAFKVADYLQLLKSFKTLKKKFVRYKKHFQSMQLKKNKQQK